ncbi:YraN family protein [Haloimpatiens lingqiaonensis]|uniref:YraN family protein n=1 Tax=Haloimpatiens lingqiaonensis TaxID=1380675 RepID=UPI0010FDDB3E|nr:YraN family protein [Haloimpatiens lingqiaonensis]
MHYLNKDIGKYGEDLAETYLKNLGYEILDKNFSCKFGEIDLIGKDKEYTCFIEVKTRYGTFYGYPCEAVTKNKQFKIYKVAQLYILKKKLFNENFRFDVMEILLNNNEKNPSIRLIKNAFYI